MLHSKQATETAMKCRDFEDKCERVSLGELVRRSGNGILLSVDAFEKYSFVNQSQFPSVTENFPISSLTVLL